MTNVYPEGKQIVFNGKAYSYDHLVLATGSGGTFFGRDEWRTFAPPMKSSSTPKRSVDVC